jgi:hypothetical protein
MIGCSAYVSAHQLQAALTTVLFNERTGRIEVMHRFFAHDAETLLGELIGPGTDILDSSEDQLRFGIYVHDRFRLYDAAGKSIELTLKGAELEGDFLWVYQAAPIPDPPLTGLQIEHPALRELWEAQVNTVNIERRGDIQTLTFAPGTKRLGVSFQ